MTDDFSRATRAAGPGPGDVLGTLLDGIPRTRSEIGSRTGLSRSTVSARVDALLRAGLVAPAAHGDSSGGRPPSRVAFNPRARLAVGIDLGATHATVAICDLRNEVLASDTIDIAVADGPERCLGDAAGLVRGALDGLGVDRSDVAAVGLGLPAPIDHETGRPQHPPIMPGWHDADVRGIVSALIPATVLVDNDVNVLALGEHVASWPDVDDLVYVKVSTGIGAGIISGGLLQHGAQGAAGDLGHIVVPWSPGGVRPADDRRELEDVASGAAIAADLRARGSSARTALEVVDLVRRGDRAAIESVRQAGRELGAVLTTVVALLAPSVIVLGGAVGRAGEHLVAGVREVVYGSAKPLASRDLRIVPARSDATAAARGAALLASRDILSPANLPDLFPHPAR
ncbi:MAG: ROK family transcriptional regulator [Microbacterium arborescens]